MKDLIDYEPKWVREEDFQTDSAFL